MDNKQNLLQPFKAYMPNPDFVGETIAPLYDTLSVDEARVVAKNNQYSFLHVSKPEIDLASDLSPYDASVYQQAQKNLSNFISEDIFSQQDRPCYLVYKISKGDVYQIGLVALCHVKAIANKYIKQHELTRKIKEDDRVNNIIAVNGSTSSVMLTHKQDGGVSDLLFTLINRQASLTAIDGDGFTHEIFKIENLDEIEKISQQYSQLNALYVADGHHRTQAALRVADKLKDNHSAQYFLTTIFPAEQLKILGYHRYIKDLNNCSVADLLNLVEQKFSITKSEHPVLPECQHEFGLYIENTWYKMQLNNKIFQTKGGSVIDELDCKIINDLLIEPILGIKDIKNDPRIDFIGGSRSAEYIMDCVNHHDSGVVIK